MNLTKAQEAQQQAQNLLRTHYNQANIYFEAGQYQQAIKELEAAKQHAADQNQLAHIENTMRTVSEMMQQNPSPSSQPETAHDHEPSESSKPDNNKLMLLTILVGLICLTPIGMKLIERYSQPALPPTEASAPASAAAENTQAAPDTPSATPAVILDANGQPPVSLNTPQETRSVVGNQVNVRGTASIAGELVTRLSANQQVKVISAQPTQADGLSWLQVETTDGKTGWVASQFLAPASPAADAPAPAADSALQTTPEQAAATSTTPAVAAGQARVNGNGVSLRAVPGTQGSLLTTLSNAEVTILEDKATQADGLTWTKIKTANGTEGWIADQFISR